MSHYGNLNRDICLILHVDSRNDSLYPLDKDRNKEIGDKMRNEKQFTLYQQFTRVFGTDEGQIVLNHIKRLCGYEQSSLNIMAADGKIDPYWVIAKEGKRAGFIDILDCLKEPPIIPDDKEEEEE